MSASHECWIDVIYRVASEKGFSKKLSLENLRHIAVTVDEEHKRRIAALGRELEDNTTAVSNVIASTSDPG